MYDSKQTVPHRPSLPLEAHPERHTIQVMGEASLSVPPDQVIIVLGVKTENASVEEAQQENSQLTNKVIETLVGLGIPQSDIQTISYQISPQYDYVDGQQVFRAYVVTHLLQVRTKQFMMAGSIIDQAVEAGANEVISVQFTTEDTETETKEALVRALNNAKEKAEALAKSLSVPLHPVPIKIQEMSMPSVQPMLFAATEATRIEPGLVTIRAEVEVWYLVG
ncbi:SIMPL domain-containing protein [Alkalicoccobacillus porphyridii]|uniref:DUF541 domain-containing protein n=1 Tax=Alkalicoccobacillus porphyridii TaxID=2597270 RepID=A0A553ZUD0_9BACI|nr:SIMPL domain-containing protein [Alkalicoccobacillus porphyridii]TSB44906.1 DUF541 domain-containing protein [Alkalicoccobacillus porphyridii]